MAKYICQYDQWPDFTWDDKEISEILGKVRHLQGMIFGQIQALGFSVKEEAVLSALTLDVLKSSEIEGEMLNMSRFVLQFLTILEVVLNEQEPLIEQKEANNKFIWYVYNPICNPLCSK
jgi:Fic family protein